MKHVTVNTFCRLVFVCCKNATKWMQAVCIIVRIGRILTVLQRNPTFNENIIFDSDSKLSTCYITAHGFFLQGYVNSKVLVDKAAIIQHLRKQTLPA